MGLTRSSFESHGKLVTLLLADISYCKVTNNYDSTSRSHVKLTYLPKARTQTRETHMSIATSQILEQKPRLVNIIETQTAYERFHERPSKHLLILSCHNCHPMPESQRHMIVVDFVILDHHFHLGITCHTHAIRFIQTLRSSIARRRPLLLRSRGRCFCSLGLTRLTL